MSEQRIFNYKRDTSKTDQILDLAEIDSRISYKQIGDRVGVEENYVRSIVSRGTKKFDIPERSPTAYCDEEFNDRYPENPDLNEDLDAVIERLERKWGKSKTDVADDVASPEQQPP